MDQTLKARLIKICTGQLAIAKRRQLKTQFIFNKILKQLEETDIKNWREFLQLKFVGKKIVQIFEDEIFGRTGNDGKKEPASKVDFATKEGNSDEIEIVPISGDNMTKLNEKQLKTGEKTTTSQSKSNTQEKNQHNIQHKPQAKIQDKTQARNQDNKQDKTQEKNQHNIQDKSQARNQHNKQDKNIDTSQDTNQAKTQEKNTKSKTKNKKSKKKNKNDTSLITYENLNDFDYIPGYNTTAYNILKSLDQSDGQSLSYINLSLKLFNDNLDSNMYVSSAIKTLIRRNLIEKEDKKYYMTNKGRALSRILFFNQDSRNRNELSTNKQSVFKFEHNLVKNDNLISGNTFLHGNLQTGTGQSRTDEILLLVDSREMKSKNDRTFFERNLPNSKSITLSIGDFIWLKNQFLINIIIERKKSTDFISSLSDGRFNEQKKRLKALGIKNIIYLIEGMKQKENFVENAIIATKLEGFTVIETNDINETVSFIQALDDAIRLTNSILNTPDDAMRLQNTPDDAMRLQNSTTNLPDGAIRLKNTPDDTANVDFLSVSQRSTTIGQNCLKSYKNCHFTSQTGISFTDFTNNSLKTKNLNEKELLFMTFFMIKGMNENKAKYLSEYFVTFEKLFESAKNKDNFKNLLNKIKVEDKSLGRGLIEKIIEYFSIIK